MEHESPRPAVTRSTVTSPLLRRPRLLGVVRSRFDAALTVIHAGPGYGKSTLLAQAIEENELDPFGVDIVVELRRRHRSPTQLTAALSAALTGSPDAVRSVDGICEQLLLRAPDEVAIVLDDLHVLDGSDSWSLLADLLEALPANGHVVVASHSMPELGVRRRQATGDAVVLTSADLEFTELELRAVVPLLASRTDEQTTRPDLPSWPALAVLSQQVGRRASIEYLWEVILAGLDLSRRTALASLARFDRIDDDVVQAVLGGDWTTESLMAGLPLVEHHDDGVRLHDLLREALADEVPPSRWRAALEAGADAMLARGDWVSAVECLRRAESTERLVHVARDFVTQAVAAGLSPTAAEALLMALPADEREGALGLHLAAVVDWSTDRRDELLQRAKDAAIAACDGELAALAVWRCTQVRAEVDPRSVVVTDEMRRLAAEGWSLAGSAVALASSCRSRTERDIEGALASLDGIEWPDPPTRRASRASLLLALGHPEKVEETVAGLLESGITEPAPAHACWLRGDVAPDEAWALARELPDRFGDRLSDVTAALAGIVTSVAIAAGHLDDATRIADTAQRLSLQSAHRVAHHADAASALVALSRDGEAEASAHFDRLLAELPVEPFPSCPHLGALTALRALRPELAWLDDIGFGTSLSTAVTAGRLVAELRAGAPPSRAAELPWACANLLRVHVPPPMLTELAVAAAPFDPDADDVLTALPNRDRFLRRIRDHPNTAVAELAAARVRGTPEPPDYRLSITCLGDFRVDRSDGTQLERLDRRERPRRLLAELVVEQSVARDAIAATMWPDLDPSAAANNLRVTLNKLIELVDPDCGQDGSWWIRADRERIELHDDVEVDVRAFDRELAAAREAEAQGAPSVADRHYQAMTELYGGDFLPGIDDVWVLPERLRLQSLAYAARCRRAELELARGEPELALGHATQAMRLDELGERALRLQIAAHAALGATGAARDLAERLRATLATARVEPSRETARLLVQFS